MNKLLIPVIIILVLVGGFIVLNYRPETLSNQEGSGDEILTQPQTGGGTSNTGGTTETIMAPTLERSLKGVSLSARNYTGEGIIDFFNKALKSNDLITWVGDWAQLNKTNSAPYLVYNMKSQYGYEAMVITAYIDQGSGTILRPLDEATKQMYLESAVHFASTYKPKYMGFGVEMNIVKKTNPEAYDEFKSFYPTVYDAVKEASPNTLVFTVWQLEHLKGLDGGLFGGVNDPEKAQWDLLGDFESDLAVFTLYPCFIYGDPSEIPDDYLTEITQHTDLLIAFSEMGWFREGVTGWESTSQEQAQYINRYFELSVSINPVFTVWSFYYDQGTMALFNNMGLMDANMTATPGLEAWSSH